MLKKYKKYYKKHDLKSQILGDDNYTTMNCNTIVFGSPGTGKTRHYIKPNILNMSGSYVVVDPCGELYQDLSVGLEKSGYKVKILNLSDIGSSMKYNPFYYVRTIRDIPELSDAIISNVNGFDKIDNLLLSSMRSLLCGIIGYMFEVYPMEQRNFANMLSLLEKASLNDKSELDLLIEELDEKTDGMSYSVIQYKMYKMYTMACEITANKALIGISVLLSIFDICELADLTCRDEMELDKVGEEKIAIFIITPNYSRTSNFLAPILCSQLLRVLYQMGEHRKDVENIVFPELKVHTTFLLDEAGNIGVIPNIDCYFATCRKYNINIACVFDSPVQLVNNSKYKKIANNIINNCDAIIHLGGFTETVKLGKYVIDSYKILKMDRDELMIYTKGNEPQKVKKFPLQYHPNYYLTSEADPSL